MSIGQIKPIIKKNLIIIKRNFVKSILQLFYPTIILVFFIIFTFETDKHLIPEESHMDYEKNYSLDYYLNSQYKGDFFEIAIVGENRTDSIVNLVNMEKYLRDYCTTLNNFLNYKNIQFAIFHIVSLYKSFPLFIRCL